MHKRKEKLGVWKQGSHPCKPVSYSQSFLFLPSAVRALSCMHTHPMLVLPLQLQVDRISIGMFHNCPWGGLMIRQGMLSSSAIFAKALPEKTGKQGRNQPNLPYSGDCRADTMRIRQSLLFF